MARPPTIPQVGVGSTYRLQVLRHLPRGGIVQRDAFHNQHQQREAKGSLKGVGQPQPAAAGTHRLGSVRGTNTPCGSGH